MTYTPLIAILVAGLGLAFILGTLAHRLRLPPLVGYLMAGIVIGPFTPGFVADQGLTRQLAEVGVILLMFGIGLHFSVEDLLSVRKIALPGALGQIVIVTALGFALSQLVGWPIEAGLIFGLALSVASTVVVLRTLQDKHHLQSDTGRIAVGWLVVQDVAMVLALVLLPTVAGLVEGNSDQPTPSSAGPFAFLEPQTLAGALGLTALKLAAFIALMILVGRRVIPWVLHYVAHTGSRELFRLAVLAIALGVAFGASELFGVSFALGAFFAGMILSESQLSQRAAQETLPLRDAFAVLFFVSVGMLFDPTILVSQPIFVAITLMIIVVGNAVAVFAVAQIFGQVPQKALLLAISLSQIGEFSFIVAGLGTDLRLLPDVGRDLILAGAMLSILLNPILFAAVHWLSARLERGDQIGGEQGSGEQEAPQLPSTTLTNHAVLVGHGRVGTLVAQTLSQMNLPYLVIEERQTIIDELRERGIEVIQGNAAQAEMLAAANVSAARILISAIPNPFESGNLIERARAANPNLDIIARAHSDAEVDYLRKLGANRIIMGEREIARGISDHILAGGPDNQKSAPDQSNNDPIRSPLEVR